MGANLPPFCLPKGTLRGAEAVCQLSVVGSQLVQFRQGWCLRRRGRFAVNRGQRKLPGEQSSPGFADFGEPQLVGANQNQWPRLVQSSNSPPVGAIVQTHAAPTGLYNSIRPYPGLRYAPSWANCQRHPFGVRPLHFANRCRRTEKRSGLQLHRFGGLASRIW